MICLERKVYKKCSVGAQIRWGGHQNLGIGGFKLLFLKMASLSSQLAMNQTMPTKQAMLFSVFGLSTLCVCLLCFWYPRCYIFCTLLFNCCRYWQIYNKRPQHFYRYVRLCMGINGYVWVYMGM